jgi:hypothetical protein
MTIIINCDFCKKELSEKEKNSEHNMLVHFANHCGYAHDIMSAETIYFQHVCFSCFRTIFKGLHSIIKEMTK